MIDVAIDVSSIYSSVGSGKAIQENERGRGVEEGEGEGEGEAFDAASEGTIRLNSGMVLYLRQVGRWVLFPRLR